MVRIASLSRLCSKRVAFSLARSNSPFRTENRLRFIVHRTRSSLFPHCPPIFYMSIFFPKHNFGVSPSGKARDSDSRTHRFESYHPSQIKLRHFLPEFFSSNPCSLCSRKLTLSLLQQKNTFRCFVWCTRRDSNP